ncbi:hypothetical protein H3L99_32310 [Streptomyces pristinaespiralis]|uniref:Uncharacterized protein n=2 Tax=Streptomyces pristinaespiralis TaxID=38300 RepID=B5H4F3_STRE2|nr:hypothetical protein SPRI_0927 [Streptomyces pristinaespiralis]EDY61714.1 conserved hypothetical protein [Streptomyces pristinaespiralis ATCC 25486]QMU17697.1 hypothetical protein H3L99_32310 [Streptomyces pristinaespiralis]
MASLAPDSSRALQSLRLPGSGRAGDHDELGIGIDDDLVVLWSTGLVWVLEESNTVGSLFWLVRDF